MELGTGPHTQPDELVERCVAGDERAFEELARRFRLGMLGTARQIIDPDAAEDVVQLALIEANKELKRGTRPESLGAWLRGITRNVAREQLRARLRTPPPYPVASTAALVAAPSTHEIAEERETVRGVVAGVEEELTDLQRTAFVGHVLEGKSHKQIALEEGVSVGSVRMAISRAREKMRRRLGALAPIPLFGWAASLFRKLFPNISATGSTVAAGAATVAVAAVAAGAAISTSGDSPAQAGGGEPPTAYASAPPSDSKPAATKRKPAKKPSRDKPRKRDKKQASAPAQTPVTQSAPAQPSAPASAPSTPAPSPSQQSEPTPQPEGPKPLPPIVPVPPTPDPQPEPTPEPSPSNPSPPPRGNCGSLSQLVPCVIDTVEGILTPG
jgi:RNA polymerase sigma factor (sigma-70 family)